MPRYLFHVYDGVSPPDQEGTELSGWEEARLEAVRLAGSILKDDAHRVALGEAWRMEVTNETGLVLFRLDFSVTTAPSTMHVLPGERR